MVPERERDRHDVAGGPSNSRAGRRCQHTGGGPLHYRDGGNAGGGGGAPGELAGFIVNAELNSSRVTFPSRFASAPAKFCDTTRLACASASLSCPSLFVSSELNAEDNVDAAALDSGGGAAACDNASAEIITAPRAESTRQSFIRFLQGSGQQPRPRMRCTDCATRPLFRRNMRAGIRRLSPFTYAAGGIGRHLALIFYVRRHASGKYIVAIRRVSHVQSPMSRPDRGRLV
jgi:hypothetical protein